MPKIDWKMLTVVIGLLGNILFMAYKGGQIVERVDAMQQSRQEFEQRIENRLERIENMFFARPGGTP